MNRRGKNSYDRVKNRRRTTEGEDVGARTENRLAASGLRERRNYAKVLVWCNRWKQSDKLAHQQSAAIPLTPYKKVGRKERRDEWESGTRNAGTRGRWCYWRKRTAENKGNTLNLPL